MVRQCNDCGLMFPFDDEVVRGMIIYEHILSEHDVDNQHQLVQDVQDGHEELLERYEDAMGELE